MLPEIVPSDCTAMPWGFFSNADPWLTSTIFMTGSNLFPGASVWVKAYSALSAHVFPTRHILSTQVSDTGPMVLWFTS